MEIYVLSISIIAGIYAVMALGLNVIWGMTGMINLGLVGFMAVGAYTSALLTVRHATWPIWAGVLAATLVSGLAGAFVARITARLKGDYLAIVTLGFSEVIRIIASNEIRFTNGTDGISAIPGPFRGQVAPATFNLLYLGLVALALLLMFLLCQRLRHSPYGRVLRAIRDDDQVTAVAGKPVMRFKTEAFAIGDFGGDAFFERLPLIELRVQLLLLTHPLACDRHRMSGNELLVRQPLEVAGEIEHQDRDQHQHRAEQGVEEEFDRCVLFSRSSPDADEKIHRQEHHFPEDVEQE